MTQQQQESREMLPAQNLDAERAVLGSILIDPDCIIDVSLIIHPESFYYGLHRVVYEAMLQLVSAKVPIDITTVSSRVGDKLDDVGGLIFITDLLSAVPTAMNAQHYAKIVAKAHERRVLENVATRIVKMARDDEIENPTEAAQSLLFNLNPASDTRRNVDIKTHLAGITEELLSEEQPDPGVHPGFADLASIVTFNKSDFIVVAARPGMGKTTFLLSMMPLIVSRQSKRILMFCLEQSPRQVTYRMLSSLSRTSSRDIMHRNLDDTRRHTVLETIGRMSNLSILIDAPGDLTPNKMRSLYHRYSMQYGKIDMIVIDYLGLMRSDGNERSSYEQTTSISKALKAAAIDPDLNIPIVAAAQLSRAPEMRQDKRPILSDLRDSGSIEQDADIVMFIYRDEYYNPDTTERPNIAEINIAKHRNGPTGVVDLYWHGGLGFRNILKQEISLSSTLSSSTSDKY